MLIQILASALTFLSVWFPKLSDACTKLEKSKGTWEKVLISAPYFTGMSIFTFFPHSSTHIICVRKKERNKNKVSKKERIKCNLSNHCHTHKLNSEGAVFHFSVFDAKLREEIKTSTSYNSVNQVSPFRKVAGIIIKIALLVLRFIVSLQHPAKCKQKVQHNPDASQSLSSLTPVFHVFVISLSVHKLTRHRSTGGTAIHPVSQYDHIEECQVTNVTNDMRTMISSPDRLKDCYIYSVCYVESSSHFD